MKCPMTFNKSQLIECCKEKCGWWLDKDNQCSVKEVSRAILRIAESMRK